MSTSIGEFISRVRRSVKGVHQDSLLTDRFIYSLVCKHAPWLMKREDGANKLLKQDTIIQQLDYVELIEIDKSSAHCRGLPSGCTIKRTKEPVPTFWEGYYGVLIRSITSLDGSKELKQTDPVIYNRIQKQTSNKYNKTFYYWYFDNHLYFPNLQWDAVRIEGVFREDISAYNCAPCLKCLLRSVQPINIPTYLFAELESFIIKDLRDMMSIPSDVMADKQSISR